MVAVAFFGDGAVNNGAFHEGLNMASIWKLPVLFVCENNQYATEVSFRYSSGNPSVGNRGAAYGMPGFELDGNDVVEIYRVAGEAIERARQGCGPTLIECKTYRTRAHAEGMGDFTYRTKEDVVTWQNRCPIKRVRSLLIESAAAPECELEAIERDTRELVEQSRQFAESSPYPLGESATFHIYSDEQEPARSAEPAPGTRETTFVAATREALDYAMAENPSVFVLGEGIGAAEVTLPQH